MATTFTRQKRPEEEITIYTDFSSEVLSGEKLIGANVTVTSTNLLTDASAPSFLSGSPVLDGTSLIVSQNVSGGNDGESFSLLFNSGLTDYGNAGYSIEVNVEVTNAPSSALMFTSRDSLKRQLGINISDTSDDILLDESIIFGSTYFRKRTRRDLYFDSYVEKIFLRDKTKATNQVYLHNYPVRAVKQIDTYYSDGTLIESITDSTKWDYDSEGRLWLHQGDTFAFFPDYNVVTYKAGYVKIPEDIEQVVKDLASIYYRNRGREGLSSEKIGSYTWIGRDIDDFPKSMRVEIASLSIEGIIKRYMRHDWMYV